MSLLLHCVMEIYVVVTVIDDPLTGAGDISRSVLRGSDVTQELRVSDESLVPSIVPGEGNKSPALT